jgi:UDP-GlcNAc:undecaprenyl-phosphate GlcNAc-1-phosphate transferase
VSMSPWIFVQVFLIAASGVLVLTPLAIRLGQRLNLVAIPDGRRKHVGHIVRIGGLGFYPAFLAATIATLGISRNDPLELTRLAGVLLSLGIVWVMGLLDDRFEFPAWTQTLGLAIASLVAIAFKVFVERFNEPFTDQQLVVDWYLMVPITIAWLMGMSGTVNLLDGLDGLATGVVGISSLVLFIHMLRLQQYTVSLLPLALLGCCVGFLPFNFNPARIFLGGGAHVLGFALGAISIVAGAKVASALLVLWVPIIDVAWQIYCRWRSGKSPVAGDRGHLHFRLQDMGWPQRRIVLLYYAITALLGSIALLVSSALLKFVVLVVIGLVVLALLAFLTRRSQS